QELDNSGTPSANFIPGLAIDEFFARSDAMGTRYPLADALGSIVELTDAAAVLQTHYTYEAYGESSAAGQASASAYQYTGRENDGTGLYYYRARYYHPAHKRVVAEDPIGIAGGSNVYAYVAGDPIQFADPSGLLFGDRVYAFEDYGESAAQYWADKSVAESNPVKAFAYDIAGVAASAWTSATSDK